MNRTTAFTISAIIALAATAFAVGTTLAAPSATRTVRDLGFTPVAVVTASAVQSAIVLPDVVVTARRPRTVNASACVPFATRPLTQGTGTVRGTCI